MVLLVRGEKEYIDRKIYLKTVAVSDINFKKDGVFSSGLLYFNDYKKYFQLI